MWGQSGNLMVTKTNPNGTEKNGENTDLLTTEHTRRGFMQATAATAAVVTLGAGSAAAAPGDTVNYNFSDSLAHDPYIPASATVVDHASGMSELEYTADDGSTASLREFGYVLAPDDDDGETANNPVSLSAAAIRTDEYTAFPRGEFDADDEPISALDADQWSTTGTMVVSNADRNALTVSGGDGDTARFEAVDITSGVSRKWLQIVQDVVDLTGSVEYRLEDSSGETVVVSNDPAGDTATDDVLTDVTGESQVGQVRVGELGSLSDIVALEVATVGGSGEVTIHGLNLDRESRWEFGTEQYYDAADERLTTRTVYEPAGEYSIRSLETLPSEFRESRIHGVSYDLQMLASELPQAQVWARFNETPETFTFPQELELFVYFEAPTAYDLEAVEFERLNDTPTFPSGRYNAYGAASGFDAPESWDDVDSITFTSRLGEISSDTEVDMLSPLNASDLVGFYLKTEMDEDMADRLTAMGGGAVGIGGSAGQQFNYWLTTILGVAGGAAFLFRKKIFGLIGRGN